MTSIQQLREEAIEARRFEYEDGDVLVADFGRDVDPAVDIVDGTAIVVTDEEQVEFDVDADARVFINNGVLTVEVEA